MSRAEEIKKRGERACSRFDYLLLKVLTFGFDD